MTQLFLSFSWGRKLQFIKENKSFLEPQPRHRRCLLSQPCKANALSHSKWLHRQIFYQSVSCMQKVCVLGSSLLVSSLEHLPIFICRPRKPPLMVLFFNLLVKYLRFIHVSSLLSNRAILIANLPSAFSMTFALLPSITATHEFVVPRSIPIILYKR